MLLLEPTYELGYIHTFKGDFAGADFFFLVDPVAFLGPVGDAALLAVPADGPDAQRVPAAPAAAPTPLQTRSRRRQVRGLDADHALAERGRRRSRGEAGHPGQGGRGGRGERRGWSEAGGRGGQQQGGGRQESAHECR